MHQERFYAIIGFFIILAFSIVLGASIFLYRHYTQSEIQTFVMLFKGSLKGLEANTPVTYRGVKIGEVSRIEITENKAGNKVEIPVYVEFFVEKTLGFTKNPMQLLINMGYIADISTPNLLTGIADITLVKNNTPVPYKQAFFRGYPVFPTRNTAEEYISVEEVLKNADKMLIDIRSLVQSKEILGTFKATTITAESLNRLTMEVLTNLPSTLMLTNQNLNKVGSAADSAKNLTDYLSRYPEALLRGKK